MTTKGQEKKNLPLTLPMEAYSETAKFYQQLPLPRNVEEHRKRAAEVAITDEKFWHAVIGNNSVRIDYSQFGFYEAMLKGKKGPKEQY